MARYTLTPRARRDLEDIWSFSADRWDEKQATVYIDDLRSAFETIADNPSRGRSCNDIRAGYSRFSKGSHVIFYRQVNGVVDVVRILHQRMDFPRHL